MKPLLEGYPDQPLVSIIIPCYNAERWLSEAILSCVQQTYRPLEIIVIDDGSTDGSLDIIKSYDRVLTWETGPNRGGNAARNRGFALSKGEYIQYLDADDYLLPEKLARDVDAINVLKTDFVYSDFWVQEHKSSSDGANQCRYVVTGAKEDLIEAILSDWGFPNASPLFHRKIVEDSDGWDEHLYAVQERDFYMTLLLQGGSGSYYTGAAFVYRRHGPVTVSTSNPLRLIINHYAVLRKAEKRLVQTDRLSPKYRRALAQGYFSIARGAYDVDRSYYTALTRKALSLNPRLTPTRYSLKYRLLWYIFGFGGADMIASTQRKIRQYLHDS